MTLRFPVAPMKATMASLPSGGDWAFEIKWDGFRTIVHIDRAIGRRPVRLQGTAGKDVSDRWPELHTIAASVHARSAILDGELVVLDDDGRPRFDLVQHSGPGSSREAMLYLFDVLQVDGIDTIDLPYEDRRRLLDQLVEAGPNWAVPAHRLEGGADLLAATESQQLEGVIAKRMGSRYRPGIRSKDWRKIKNRIVVQLPIGGFTAGAGNRSSTFGALLVGRRLAHPDGANGPHEANGALAFAGGVGTGFDQPTLEALTVGLRQLATDRCPFDPPPPASVVRTATWVEPVLTVEVEIAEFTNDGLVRHASFLRLLP